MIKEEKYDVVFSFAGAQREYVEKTKNNLEKYGISVFYDKDHEVELWGKNLYRYFSELYSKGAKYCVMFISKEYYERPWTLHESQSAQEKMFGSYDHEYFQEYILPVKFDETRIPGIRETTGYLDARKISPEALAQKIAEKGMGYLPDIETVSYLSMGDVFCALIDELNKVLSSENKIKLIREDDYCELSLEGNTEGCLVTLQIIANSIYIYLDDSYNMTENPFAIVYYEKTSENKRIKLSNLSIYSYNCLESYLSMSQLVDIILAEINNLNGKMI